MLMNRIDKKFIELKKRGQKALITYITAGDPGIKETEKIVYELVESGADIIELGIPYSDPIADGPVIQRASQRALSKNIKINNIIDTVKNIRKTTQVPILFLVYYNCIYQYGTGEFLNDASNAGVDGLIIPDLPYEESNSLKERAEYKNIHIISLIAPTSENRIKMISSDAKGFIYCVSCIGVTGAREKIDTSFLEFVSKIKDFSEIPRAIGFGISTPEQIKQLKELCEGIIVGSAIVKIIEEFPATEILYKKVGNFVKELKKSINMI